MFKKIYNSFKKLDKVYQCIIIAAIAYYVYITYVQVDNFFNVDVEDKPVSTNIFDTLAQNVGLETSNTLKQKPK